MKNQPTLLPFNLEESKRRNMNLTSFGGIPLILETYRGLGLDRVVAEHMRFKNRGWSENDLLEELIMLQIAGGDCMDDIEYFRKDGVKTLFGDKELPSNSSSRRFLHMFDKGVSEPRSLGEAYIPEENEFLKSLGEVNHELVRKLVKRKNPSYMTIDADATVSFSHKRNALATYKGGTGYQPIVAIWAEKGIVISDQFRDGNVNAAAGALEFLKRIESNIPREQHKKKRKLRIRSDGAWYQHDVMEYCVNEGYEFSISADVSYGLRRWVNSIPEDEWRSLYRITKKGKVRDDKEYAVLKFTTASLSQANIRKRIEDYHYILIRTKRRQPDLIDGSYRYNAIATNMEWDTQRQIWWHYERCGSVEKVIDILKNDFGGGKFPCGTFGANAAWWRITCIAHNLVQALKIIALPFSLFYTRMKTLRFRLFCIAGRIIKHARRIYLQLARGHPILPIYRQARENLASFA